MTAPAEIEKLASDMDMEAECAIGDGLPETAERFRLCAAALREMSAELSEIRAVVNEQAEDDALWLLSPTASEAYMMHALRELHRIIEEAGR